MTLSRRALWFVLWATSACVGGPISDLPHSGTDDGEGAPRPGNAGPKLDAGVAPPGVPVDQGSAGSDAADGGARDGGDAGTAPIDDPCADRDF